MKKISELWCKYKEYILYIFFGVCTTAVNFVCYFLCKKAGLGISASVIISWMVSVLFAYITNKLYVFESRVKTPRDVLKEIISFSSGRIATGIMDLVIMFVFVQKMRFNEPFIKILSNIIVIVLNYIISKLVVFRRKEK